jgi:hypothetical protein
MVMADTVAVLGFLMLLTAFGLNATGRMDRTGVSYDALNASGAGILSWYATTRDVPIFVILELAWALIASASLVRRVARRYAIAGSRT